MSQFKYEIDERNLRLQLRAMELPYSEEAWHKFENFSASCKTGSEQRAVKRFQLSFNRNVVLPVVFGSVIVLFSLLLFNFVNIKNPAPNREARAASMASSQKPAQDEEKKAETLPAETAAEPVATPAQQEPAAESKAGQAPPVVPQQQAVAAEVKEQPAQLPPAEPARELNSQIKITKSQVPTSDSQAMSTEVRRKKSKKRQEVMVEPVPGEDEQAPPPVEAAPQAE